VKDYTKSTENMINTINEIKERLNGHLEFDNDEDFLELTALFSHLQNLIYFDQETLNNFADRIRVLEGKISYEDFLQNRFKKFWL
jgi:hypothetical protein